MNPNVPISCGSTKSHAHELLDPTSSFSPTPNTSFLFPHLTPLSQPFQGPPPPRLEESYMCLQKSWLHQIRVCPVRCTCPMPCSHKAKVQDKVEKVVGEKETFSSLFSLRKDPQTCLHLNKYFGFSSQESTHVR